MRCHCGHPKLFHTRGGTCTCDTKLTFEEAVEHAPLYLKEIMKKHDGDVRIQRLVKRNRVYFSCGCEQYWPRNLEKPERRGLIIPPSAKSPTEGVITGA